MRKGLTREQFIERAQSIHGDKYDYTKIDFINIRTPVEVYCNFHNKTWPVQPYGHAKSDGTGSECKFCHGFGRTTHDFIDAATQVHGDKYDYSKANYILASNKVKVYCPKHDWEWGVTWQSHIISQSGCKYCARESKINVEDVISRFKKVHKDLYDYSLYTKWEGWHQTFEVKCKKHEGYIFKPTPASHFYQKSGCDKCFRIKLSLLSIKPQELYIKQAKVVHANRYDYSQTVYEGDKKDLTIICKEHGPRTIRADHHLSGSGCMPCWREIMSSVLLYSFNDFFKIANEVHLGKYKYKEETYSTYNEEITIICPEHGEFRQVAWYHAKGSGCISCNQSKGEREVERFLLNKNIKYEKQKKFPGCKRKRELPFDFWIPFMRTLIEYDGEQHYKERKEGIYKGKFEDIQQRDNIKNEFCKKVGLTLLRIRWDEDINKELSMFFNVLKASN